MKPKLVVIAGPTAVGKTAVAVELALRQHGEIISADSMQVYKHMNIGTAKPTNEEMKGIKHYLIDEIEPDDDYSVAIFVHKARQYIDDIHRRGKLPIVVGGTGFYINALIFNNEFMSTNSNDVDIDIKYRKELYDIAKSHGADSLHNILMKIDLTSANRIHPNNVKRVVRALEFHKLTGKLISEHNDQERERTSPYSVSLFILNMQRDTLYKRIELRIDKMIEEGLVAEVQGILAKGISYDRPSMLGLGYKEIVPYIQGQISLEEAIAILKRNTRRFAKRQITWFKNQCQGIWINVDETCNPCIIDDTISIIEREQLSTKY
ncbi:MAG: tRNA (adenosine(37)-N6)-dimethylallyltransferase MiaA [Defluviitaleaceae bacterium]|nr:tRNA (adenosine(37)-N6)-dimethylallyltransferase MiaA [Defluviitaleaceae bacterium]